MADSLAIKQPIQLNTALNGVPPTLHMVQGDTNSRTISAALWSGAEPYNVPTGASVMLRFRKPDGTGGLYAESEAGDKISWSGSDVEIPVAAQVLAVAGVVLAQVDVFVGAGSTAAMRLATFAFRIAVQPDVYADAQIISSDYYKGIINAPYIGENNHWYAWDTATDTFKDTGVSAVGPEGPPGRDGSTIVADGLFGFDVDPDTGQLRLYYTGDTPPDFSLDADGHLIYKLSPDVSVDIGVVKGADGDTTLNITGASVGQVARVQEVDSDGRPIKWEAASVSAGVGEIYDESSGISVRYPEKMTIQVAQASRWGRLVQVVLQIVASEAIPVNYGWIATLPRIANTRAWFASTLGNNVFFVNAESAQINCNQDVFPAGTSMLFGTYLTNENVEGVIA